MRTVPPLTTAAARNGTALDRSGSTSQCRAATAPGAPASGSAPRRPPRPRPVAASPPSSRCAAPTAPTSGVHDRQPVGERGPGQHQAGHELRRRRCVDARPRPPAHRVHCPEPGRAARPRRRRTPRPRSASSSGAMGRARACSSPSKVTAGSAQRRQRRNETQDRAGQAAVHARIGAGLDSAARRVSSVHPRRHAGPASRSAPIIRSVSRLRNASAEGRCALPLRARQRREDQRAVGLGFRARDGHRRVHRCRCRRGRPCAHWSIIACRAGSVGGICHHWRYVWTFRSHHRSGLAGREDQGNRRSHRRF